MDVPIIGGRQPSEGQRLNMLRGLAREKGVKQPDGIVVAKPSDVPKARPRRARRN